MKIIRLLSLSLVWLIARMLPCTAQVKDVGQFFTRQGYIQEVCLQDSLLLINYISADAISTEPLRLTPKTTVIFNRKQSDNQQLRCGMKVDVEGEFYETKHRSEATKISISTQYGQRTTIKLGRLDDISGGFAYIDGNKVKLKSGKKIMGAKDTGYANKNFADFTELKLGSLLDIEGEYMTDNYIMANKVTVTPETETAADKLVKEDNQASAQTIYANWNDPAKRTTLFGKNFEDQGRIVNDAKLQDYVSNLAMKLIPAHVKDKFHFAFIVTDKKEWNANVRPNGVSVVYLGLLLEMQNEAQLAAVLSHEIAHAIYEHQSLLLTESERTNRISDLLMEGTKQLRKITPDSKAVTIKNKKGEVIFSKDIKTAETADLLMKELPGALENKRMSNFKVAQEQQADRVGLFLLVQAGYDPREATLVWKNKFNQPDPAPAPTKTEGKQPSAGSPAPGGTAATQSLDKKAIITAAGKGAEKNADKGVDWVNTNLRRKIDAIQVRNLRTHPDRLQRFEDLNALIGAYYSDPHAIANSKVATEAYLKAIQPTQQKLLADQKKLEQYAKKEQQQRPLLKKKFDAAQPGIKTKLTSLTRPVFTYKGYSLRPVVKITDFVGKQPCDNSAIREMVENAQLFYEPVSKYVAENTKQLKDGTVEAKRKDYVFAYNFLLAQKVNDFAVNFATAATVCDYQSTTEYRPTPEVFIALITNIGDSPELNQMISLLSAK